MKFMSAVVILALAVFAQASVLPLSYAGWGGVHVIPAPTVVQGNGLVSPWGVHAYAAPWAPAAVDASWGLHAHALAAPIHAVHAAPIHAIHSEASYVAANRGSVHTAPLPGHAVSQQSLNLEPAAGTW